MTGTAGSALAKEAAREFLDKPITNAEIGFVAVVTKKSLGKMTSASAWGKSILPQAHYQAVGNVLFAVFRSRLTQRFVIYRPAHCGLVHCSIRWVRLSVTPSTTSLINPYWSFIGVKALIRRLTRASFAEVEMSILTQPRNSLSLEERHSLQQLVDEMENKGAKCTVLAPIFAGMGTPLLHAKAMAVDYRRAYLGSANITGSGMDFNVELGMEFEGDLARQLGEWLQFIAGQMQAL